MPQDPQRTYEHVARPHPKSLTEQVGVGLSISLLPRSDMMLWSRTTLTQADIHTHALTSTWYVYSQFQGGFLFPMGTGVIKDSCELCKTSGHASTGWQPGVMVKTML